MLAFPICSKLCLTSRCSLTISILPGNGNWDARTFPSLAELRIIATRERRPRSRVAIQGSHFFVSRSVEVKYIRKRDGQTPEKRIHGNRRWPLSEEIAPGCSSIPTQLLGLHCGGIEKRAGEIGW